MKIKTKIIFNFVPIYFIISLLLIITTGYLVITLIVNQNIELINTLSITKTNHLRSYLNGQKEVITMLGASTVFRDLLQEQKISSNYPIQKQRVYDRLTRTIKADSNINEIFLIDQNAKVIVSTDIVHEGTEKSTDSFFTQGMKAIFIKDIYFSSITNSIVWGLASPISDDKSGKIIGVVVMRIKTEPLYKILKMDKYINKTGETFIVNSSKYFISPLLFLGNNVILTKKVETQNANNCFDPQETGLYKSLDDSRIFHKSGEKLVNLYRDYRNVTIFGTHSYIPETGWCLITKIDQSEVYEPIIQILFILTGIGISGFIIFIVLGSILSRKITQPIEALSKGVAIIQKGNLSYQVGINSQDEIGQLSREFDNMTRAIKQSRADIDIKVAEQTNEIIKKSKEIENQQKATLNILEDVENEKNKADIFAQDLEKFKLAVANASDHIVITDSEGIIIYANHAVERITGYKVEETIGKKAGSRELWGGLMLKPIYTQFWKTIKTEKKVFTGEFENKRVNGDKYIAEAHVSPILDKHGNVRFFIGIERDITKAKEIDRMKTEFISLASHQLRTPLSAMKWFTEMLLNGDMGSITKEQTEAITNVYQSNERMIALVNSLLNISRIESGRIIIDPKPTNLNKLINEVIISLQNKIQAKKTAVILSIHPNLPLINIDVKLIREVYANLLSNAIKYTRPNGEITFIVSKKNDEIISQIQDNGYGIPENQQNKIFDKFFRADNAVKYETDGNGLGLYLVKSIIESSKGKIWFSSKENQGTTFWFSLPIGGMEEKKGQVSIA